MLTTTPITTPITTPVTLPIGAASTTGSTSPTDRPTTLDGATWVEAAPFRAHLLFLSQACDVSWPVLAALAGVSQRGARALVVGRGRQPLRRIHPGIASRVLALDEARVRGAAGRVVGGEHVRHRLDALTAAGWTVTGLAERIRMPLAAPGLDALLRDRQRPASCTELTAAVVAALSILCGTGAPPVQATGISAPLRRPSQASTRELADTIGRAA